MRAFLLSGRGRVDRLGYLAALLIVGLLFCIPLGLLAPTAVSARLRPMQPELFDNAVLFVGTFCWLVLVWIYCATTARRLHDIGRSGWLAVLALIPAIGLGALTVALLLLPGEHGHNRYGSRWL